MDNESHSRAAAPLPRPRRVFTAPASTIQPTTRIQDISDTQDVETLYVHPNAKIISFSTPHKDFGPEEDVNRAEAGTLPWSNRLERTIGVGNLRIYRAPGSVAFLSCNTLVQPILPKSQCWSVIEDDTKFVLRIRRPHYWRIELPASKEGGKEKALELKNVLDRILQFEKTHCPFVRSFTVDIPDPPSTPVAKRPWTPQESPAANPVTEALRGSLDHRMYFQSTRAEDVSSFDTTTVHHQTYGFLSQNRSDLNGEGSPASASSPREYECHVPPPLEDDDPPRVAPAGSGSYDAARSTISTTSAVPDFPGSPRRSLKSRWSWTSEDLPTNICGCAECVAERALNAPQQAAGSTSKCYRQDSGQATESFLEKASSGFGMLWRRNSLPTTLNGGLSERLHIQGLSKNVDSIITSLESLQSKLLMDTHFQGTIAGPVGVSSSSERTAPPTMLAPLQDTDIRSASSDIAVSSGPASKPTSPKPAGRGIQAVSAVDDSGVMTSPFNPPPLPHAEYQFPSQRLTPTYRYPSYENFSPLILRSFRLIAKACKLLLVPPILISALALRAGVKIATRLRTSRAYNLGFGFGKDSSVAIEPSTEADSSFSEGELSSASRSSQIRHRTVPGEFSAHQT